MEEPIRIKCDCCDGEGQIMNICPLCNDCEIENHIDIGKYCPQCGSLEGLTRADYPYCTECDGKGYLNKADVAEEHYDYELNRGDDIYKEKLMP